MRKYGSLLALRECWKKAVGDPSLPAAAVKPLILSPTVCLQMKTATKNVVQCDKAFSLQDMGRYHGISRQVLLYSNVVSFFLFSDKMGLGKAWSDDPDLNNRDPNNLNDHLQVGTQGLLIYLY